jgi:hypothetical protein
LWHETCGDGGEPMTVTWQRKYKEFIPRYFRCFQNDMENSDIKKGLVFIDVDLF